jgi:Ca2+/H+ antiporter, TMEM165/GDT1 family
VTGFFVAFALVFVAEIGDKSQLLVLAFTARYRAAVVLPAIFVATAAIHLLSVSVGAAVARIVPMFWIQIAAGLAFVAFGILALRGRTEAAGAAEAGRRWGPAATIAGTFFVSEFGDKTMLTAIAVSSQYPSFLTVWAGSTLGMFLADSIAVAAGVLMGRHLPQSALRIGAAAVFLLTGVVTLYLALR